MSEVPLEGRKKMEQKQSGKNLKISMSIRKDTLDSLTTKDKGKAVLTAIQYSAPDSAIPFSFYNHPNHSGYGLMGQVSVLENRTPHVDIG